MDKLITLKIDRECALSESQQSLFFFSFWQFTFFEWRQIVERAKRREKLL